MCTVIALVYISWRRLLSVYLFGVFVLSNSVKQAVQYFCGVKNVSFHISSVR